MAQKIGTPKGTRDFHPFEVVWRNYIFDTMKKSFELFGFQPIETPSFEYLSTLMGKYGEEGDRLIFKILNSGDYLAKADENLLNAKESAKVTSQISEKALRYDLTVPFARYVVQHQNWIDFPFKRYQMQPVWRADRPQKARFREFYQCDADVVGSTSLFQEVECIQLYDDVFTNLGLRTDIRINNRKILSGITEVIGEKEKLIDFTVALDKLDKIGALKVINEMRDRGISEMAIEQIKPLLQRGEDMRSPIKLPELKEFLKSSDEGTEGIKELEFVIDTVNKLGLKSARLVFDITLARGLNYYTGAIFEVTMSVGNFPSIGGGGRYDNLTENFGLKNMSGIGISFGLDRIYMILEQYDLLESIELPKPKVLFLNFGSDEATYCLQAIKTFRESAIKTELYPDNKKIKKQLDYANKREIEFVVMVGSEELENNTYTLKNMNTGEQATYNLIELLETVLNS